MAHGQAPKTLYARRGQDPVTREPITFVSDDQADRRPRGWVKGWFEDGHEFVWPDAFAGHRLLHVYEPSWRVSAPARLPVAEAA